MSERDTSGADTDGPSTTASTGGGTGTASDSNSAGGDTETASDSNSAGGGTETAPPSDSTGRDGPRFVLALYAILIGITAAAGFLIGIFVEGIQSPKFLFLIPFPATPLGFAAYGGLTIAIVLGIPLALVVYVSRNFAA